LYQEDSERANRFPLDLKLETAFRNVCSELLPPDISKKILIEYPYYHLTSDSIWDLHFLPGKEDEFHKYEQSPNMRLTRKRLIETVSYACLENNLDTCFRKPSSRKKLYETLRQYVIASGNSLARNGKQLPGRRRSLFGHEAEAISTINERVVAASLGRELSNLEIHDPQSNRYFEIDVVIISGFGIYVVELKHWSGRIEVRPNSWVQNGSFYRPDPHKINGFKAKLIRGIYERKFPSFPGLYVESVVVFTNTEALVDGSTVPRTEMHNPTFESIDRFIDYMKHHQGKKPSVLSHSRVDAFANYLGKLTEAPRPRDFVFPGYEIVERIYQHEDRAEIVARPTEVKHRRLSRLRLFFPQTVGDTISSKTRRERATATLNAVTKIGDHPNILKVWSVPNDYGYIVEGSDWSETGTLRDFLDRKSPLLPDKAIVVTTGILRGLEAVHRESVIHRNLSPESILMEGEAPKLMNFDLSYQLEDDERITVIPDTSELKRSAHIAPEIYAGGPLMEAADLFSVGVILYEMLTGERPFSCSTDLEHMGGHLTNLHQKKLIKRDIPTPIAELLFDLVQLNPDSRPSNVEDVLARLRTDSSEGPIKPMTVNPELSPGTTYDVYEIEEFVKRGAESQIYKARGPRGSLVALKLFNSDVSMPRILNEQEMAAGVRHGSLVRVDDIHSWKDGRFYLPFDWISGKPLRADIEKVSYPSLDQFKHVAVQLLEVLQALHSCSDDNGEPLPILHNDIKPENILIDENGRVVLIDFGSASHPHVGLYSGTEGYVAPDLRMGQDRFYNEDGDLYGLGVSLFEWFFCRAPYKRAIVGAVPESILNVRQDVLPYLMDWFLRAVATESRRRFVSVSEMADALQSALFAKPRPAEEILHPEDGGLPESVSDDELLTTPVDETISSDHSLDVGGNPFIPYLNSLHSLDADSENALAESQATNPSFSLIHVPHPIAPIIEETLIAKKEHVILTGHAGDGKSTIGIEIYKRLCGLPADSPLKRDMPPRVEVQSTDQRFVIIKDFSEWSEEDRQAILLEALDDGNARFLIISNTGTLLDTFRGYEKESGGDWAGAESNILKCLEMPDQARLIFQQTPFSIINLAMIDNLSLGEQVFRRMVAKERWAKCEHLECRGHCPIYRNVSLILENKSVVRRRIFLLYRRMHEYGSRFTLRQLTAHLAYMLTSGVTCGRVAKMGRKATPPRMTEFMFFNRFFGDNGRERDEPAVQLPAVRQVCDVGLGLRPCPSWERRLWARTKGEMFIINAQECKDEFRVLRAVGAGLKSEEEINSYQAREQVRRMVFFLHHFQKNDDGAYLRTFLDSPMLLDYVGWQEAPKYSLSLVEKTNLKQRVVHVLQEHFTGVRLPEGSMTERDLFITLSRRSHEIRQSAQVVLARISEDDLNLELNEQKDALGNTRRTLLLSGRQDRIQASLLLDLPFLDYVMLRNQGEVGSALLPSYVDRLERFRGCLIKQAGLDRGDDIMLVRLRTNHTFRRQVFAVRDDRLEVTDG